MKALVTGGAGFIGSHLSRALCGLGARVLILDDLSHGSLGNLAWSRPTDAVDFVEGSVADAPLVRRLVAGCDWVFHEAALVSVPDSVQRPLASHEVNTSATLTLLVAARDAAVKRFVFASSCAIYGDDATPAKREDLPPRPLTPYALQKYASERYGQLFHALYGLETVSLRYFNVFGPRQSASSPYAGVIAKFCACFLAGERPTIFGDGGQSRDFVFVDDIVEANLQAARQPAELVAGKVFNVGTGESRTLLDLLAGLRRLTGQQLEPVFEEARPGDIRTSLADLRSARAALAFEPRTGWDEGLARTLEFQREAGAR
jgi:UDP-glucose 4-epimerase